MYMNLISSIRAFTELREAFTEFFKSVKRKNLLRKA